MVNPRWKKVLRDMWSSRARTALVVVSIFIGVFATGLISGTRSIVVNELEHSYQQTNPAHTTIRLSGDNSFDDDLVQVVSKIDGVGAVEGRRTASLEVAVAPNDWETLSLTGIPDFENIQVNQIRFLAGSTDPRDKEILIERSSMDALNIAIGDHILVETKDGDQETLTAVGVVHDLEVQPTTMTGNIHGYVTMETMEWLGEGYDYTRMLLRVAPDAPISANGNGSIGRRSMGGRSMASNSDPQTSGPSMMQITSVLEEVQDKIEKSEREVGISRGPHGRISNEHWATSFISNLSMMMNVLGVVSLFLSGFLVTNTISALLAQQVRQIGIMKAIGARNRQILGMYMVKVFGFGVLALLLAVPITLSVTDVFVSFIAEFFNFDLSGASFPSDVLFMQGWVSLAIPVIASLAPVLTGTRISVLDALNSESIQTNTKQKERSWGLALSSLLSHLFKRPLVLSVRNTFRRKVRVGLTLLTLTVGGLIFTGIFTLRASLINTLNEFVEREFQFDIVLLLEGDYADYQVLEAIDQVPGIAIAESWLEGSATRVYDNGWESDSINVSGVPPDSQLIEPTIIEGRWLMPEDESAIVISTGVLEDDPDIEVGSEIVLNINERESTWRVVGISTGMGDSREAYATYDFFGRVTGNIGETSNVRILFDEQAPYSSAAIQEALQTHLERQGIEVGNMFNMREMLSRVMKRFDFIILGLMSMALVMAVVGGLGLAGTMSLNVIERTREIGIMRAIGASNLMILQIFLGEGLLIGIISWLLGALLALPISKVLSDAMGAMFFRAPLSFSFSYAGMLAWLAITVVLAILASFVPAWNATRLTVRNALAYE